MTEEEEKSRIYIEFESLGSAQFTMKLENVTPIQLLALSQYFEFEGKMGLSMQKAQHMEDEQMKKIVVPKPEIQVAHK